MISNLMKLRQKEKVIIPSFDEEAEYMHLCWDNEHGQLPLSKQLRFEELKRKYGAK